MAHLPTPVFPFFNLHFTIQLDAYVLHSTWNVLLVYRTLRRSCSASFSHGVFWWGWGLMQYSSHLPLDPESVETVGHKYGWFTALTGLKNMKKGLHLLIAQQNHQQLLLQIPHLLLQISCSLHCSIHVVAVHQFSRITIILVSPLRLDITHQLCDF